MKDNLGIFVISIFFGLALIAFVFGSAYVLKGISQDSKTKASMPEDRFIKIEDWGDNFVMYDRKTKVQYFVFGEYNHGGGITVLVDADGKPLLYEGD